MICLLFMQMFSFTSHCRLGYLTKGIAQMQRCLTKVVCIYSILDEFTALCNVVIYVEVCFVSCLDRNLYTIRAVPFTDIRSIRRHTPALGWQYIIVVLSSGKVLLMNLRDFLFTKVVFDFLLLCYPRCSNQLFKFYCQWPFMCMMLY